MNLDALAQKVKLGDRQALAKVMTLIESTRQEDRSLSEKLLMNLMKEKKRGGFRVGFSGIPGVGKSTFIENIGKQILQGSATDKLAVLTIDPTSPISGGSILGDKTRMPELTRHPRAFVRPSPNKKKLGGVTSSTQEIALLLEIAGFKYIFIETLGVGQAEFEVDKIVDLFVLLYMPSTGDELQTSKKGILELADLIVVNKADGNLLEAAKISQAMLQNLPSKDGANKIPILLSSCEKPETQKNVWTHLTERADQLKEQGLFEKKRRRQIKQWFDETFNEQVLLQMKPYRDSEKSKIYDDMLAGTVPPSVVAKKLISKIFPKTTPLV